MKGILKNRKTPSAEIPLHKIIRTSDAIKTVRSLFVIDERNLLFLITFSILTVHLNLVNSDRKSHRFFNSTTQFKWKTDFKTKQTISVS